MIVILVLCVASCVATICLEDSKMNSSNVANDSYSNILWVQNGRQPRMCAAIVMDAIRCAVCCSTLSSSSRIAHEGEHASIYSYYSTTS